MVNDFITMLAAAFLAVVVVFAARHALRKILGVQLPKWAMPATAGVAMLFATIWSEYAWYPRLRAGLPETATILRTVEESKPWRPWTYVFPMTVRAIALDRGTVLHPAPGIAQTELLLMQRWMPVQPVSVAYDCENAARADLVEGAQINPDGTLTGAEWYPLDATDEGLKAACLGG